MNKTFDEASYYPPKFVKDTKIEGNNLKPEITFDPNTMRFVGGEANNPERKGRRLAIKAAGGIRQFKKRRRAFNVWCYRNDE